MTTLAIAAIVTAVSAVAAGTVSGVEGAQAAEEKEQQLEEQQRQVQLAAAQQANQRLAEIQRVTATQTTQALARGISTSSPSFTAIETTSVNNFGTTEKISDTETNLQENALQQQIDQTRSLKSLGILGSVFGTITKAGEDVIEAKTAFGQPPASALSAGAAQQADSFGSMIDAQGQLPSPFATELDAPFQDIATFDQGEGA